jgi:hypothetical protein
MSDPQTASEPELLFDPYNPDRNIVRRCASLTINGVQCKQAALRGQNYCVAHIDRQPRAFENPGHIVIPLLEDHSAIQLTCTKVGHALANERMKPDVAKEILHACTVANSTLPRPARLQPSDLPQPRSEAALSVVDQLGTWIATCEPFLSPSGEMTKYDELDARWTRKNKTEIDPATAVTNMYRQLIRQLVGQRGDRETDESAAALAAGRPDPHPGKWNPGILTGHCPFLAVLCEGPLDPSPCACCRGERPMPSSDPRHPGDDAVALVAAFRNHLQQQKQNVQENSAARVPHIRPPLSDVGGHDPNSQHETEPNLVPALNAVADTHRSTRRRARPLTRRRATSYRLQAAGSPHVVKLVNTATHNIPNGKELVPCQKHNISPQKAKERSPRSLPLLTLDRHRARYFALNASPLIGL